MYLVDTNILIDYYLCFYMISYRKSIEDNVKQAKYCKSLRDLLVSTERLLMSDLSMREFMLKLIDKFVESLTPPPKELGNRDLIGFTDELVKKLVNNLGISVVNTNGEVLNEAYEVSRIVNEKISTRSHSKDSRRRELRKLGRDVINMIHAYKNDASC
ncbi:hypothetical protein GCM10007112_16540 [Vulcanisaeta souniana JCM 11219]|uniref:PIN domain-containing protein n=2 Tax=Vulcanisaeta souniana JCM 11219 TaxID=1293586 RepID=A0A830EAI3_9CREN|nr:hypothetical protein GCM10007112_16540 [Vulcanisaeta souniana JCM 11219]